MAILTDSKIRSSFLAKFSRGLSSFRFDSLVEFNEPQVGISFKKKLRDDGCVSLIKIAILNTGEPRRRDLFASVTYGEDNGSAIVIRSVENTKRDDPIDLEFIDDFYYDSVAGQIYHGTEKIRPLQLLEEIYAKHIKPTRTLVGLLLRVRYWFWRHFLTDVIKLLSQFTKILLFILSGTHYSYDAFWEGTELADSFANPQVDPKEKTEGGKVMLNFLGIEAKRWPILFYCFLHLGLYLLFFALNIKPQILVVMLQNNFLTLVYVVVTVTLIEAVTPDILKKLIRSLSRLSVYLSSKKIKV